MVQQIVKTVKCYVKLTIEQKETNNRQR
jgi:hypothetical protein